MSQTHFSTRKNTNLHELHKLFIRYKLHGVCNAPKTITNYQNYFALLLRFNPNITVHDLTEHTIIRFLEFLNTRTRKVGTREVVRGYKTSSLATARSSLSTFFEWLVERHYIEVNPFEHIPYPKFSYTDRRAFTSKEFDSICLAVCNKIKWHNILLKKRNVAIIMFLTYTGVRKEELLSLQLSDIDIEGKVITVRAETSKSKRTRLIPMNPELIPYVEDYLHVRKHYTTSYLWVSGTKDRGFTEHGAKHLLTTISKATDINCHLHRFRHTFATNYYNQRRDLLGLKKLMGHTKISMTLSYLRSLPDDFIVEQIQKMTINEFV